MFFLGGGGEGGGEEGGGVSSELSYEEQVWKMTVVL